MFWDYQPLIMGIRHQNMPRTSNALLSPTRGNYLNAPLCMTLHAPVCLRHALCAFYDWLRVPTAANHSLTRTLSIPYACLRKSTCIYVLPYVHLTCTLCAFYDWWRVPTTANHSLTRVYVHLTFALCAPYTCLRTLTRALRASMRALLSLWLVKGPHHSQSDYWHLKTSLT